MSGTSEQALRQQIEILTGTESELPHIFAVLPPPPKHGGPTPSYPILTEEVGYPPSPLAGGAARTWNGSNANPGSALTTTVNRAIQDVLGWKIKQNDAAGFVGALKQSFQLDVVDGVVVSTWRPRSYAVQADLSSGLITGAQASIYTMAKTLLDQMLPLIDGLTPLDPASDAADVAALKQLATSQLKNLVGELSFAGGPRVMRVSQYFQTLLGVRLNIRDGTLHVRSQAPPVDSPLHEFLRRGGPAVSSPWTNPDYVLGSLGDLRDQLGLSELIPPSYINTIPDEQNVTNYRIIVDYTNSLLNVWVNNIKFFLSTATPFLGTQLVGISRQLGVVGETVDEVRFVLDSVFIGPAQRETTQIVFHSLPQPSLKNLPTIYLEDLLTWMENFVDTEAPDLIQSGGRLALGEDFVEMILQLHHQAQGFYLFAGAQAGALGTDRVLQSIYKLVNQLQELYQLAAPVSTKYIAPRP